MSPRRLRYSVTGDSLLTGCRQRPDDGRPRQTIVARSRSARSRAMHRSPGRRSRPATPTCWHRGSVTPIIGDDREGDARHAGRRHAGHERADAGRGTIECVLVRGRCGSCAPASEARPSEDEAHVITMTRRRRSQGARDEPRHIRGGDRGGRASRLASIACAPRTPGTPAAGRLAARHPIRRPTARRRWVGSNTTPPIEIRRWVRSGSA